MAPPVLAWLHNLSPFLVQFSGSFGLRWYGLAYATGFVLGWLWLRWMSKRGMTPLSPQKISDAMLLLVLGVVVGGRLGYVLFYDPSLLGDFSSSPPWWGVFRLNNGGMSSHGGMIGVVIATWFIARTGGPAMPAAGAEAKKPGEPAGAGGKVPWMHVLDLTALTCTVGLMLGRVANFINGELLGKIVAEPGQPAPWWTVKFPQEIFSGHDPKLNHEQNLKLWAIIDQFRIGTEADKVAYERAVRTLQGGGEKAAAVAKQLGPILSSRYPSQLMQAVTDGLVLGLALWLIWWKPRKPGVIGAWFMVVYGVMRIATEFVRLPDTQLQGLKDNTGLSMGQWLSVLMVLGGAVGLVFMSRRDVPKMGGWGKAARTKASV